MYIPPKFRIEDKAEIQDFLHQNSFGALISLVDSRITATHIPWHLTETPEGAWIMQGHIAKANPHWKALEASPDVMLMFQGAHTYVSSRWYSEENAPTWNYQAVHLYGQARVTTQAELEQMLAYLMRQYEGDTPNSLHYEHLSEKLREGHLKAIVGIEVVVTEVQAKYKLSQNRSAFDFQNIIKELENTPDSQAHEVAQQMRKLER